MEIQLHSNQQYKHKNSKEFSVYILNNHLRDVATKEIKFKKTD